MGVFKAYDIRGIYNKDWDKNLAYKIGFLLPELLKTDKFLIGRDARVSSDEIFEYLTNPWNADSDGDGLKDGEEVHQYKTSPNNKDTDGDGLTDYEEIITYQTDPLNPDTDGDGFVDGQEVSYGFNPLEK